MFGDVPEQLAAHTVHIEAGTIVRADVDASSTAADHPAGADA